MYVDAPVLIEQCTFELGYAAQGAALFVTDFGTGEVRHSRFLRNNAAMSGGAIYLSSSLALSRLSSESRFELGESHSYCAADGMLLVGSPPLLLRRQHRLFLRRRPLFRGVLQCRGGAVDVRSQRGAQVTSPCFVEPATNSFVLMLSPAAARRACRSKRTATSRGSRSAG